MCINEGYEKKNVMKKMRRRYRWRCACIKKM